MIELKDRDHNSFTEEISFNIYKDGDEIAWMTLTDRGDELYIQDIFPSLESDSRDPLGVSGVRELLRALKREFPFATKISGWRYGGSKHITSDNEYDEEGHFVELRI